MWEYDVLECKKTDLSYHVLVGWSPLWENIKPQWAGCESQGYVNTVREWMSWFSDKLRVRSTVKPLHLICVHSWHAFYLWNELFGICRWVEYEDKLSPVHSCWDAIWTFESALMFIKWSLCASLDEMLPPCGCSGKRLLLCSSRARAAENPAEAGRVSSLAAARWDRSQQHRRRQSF